MEEGVDTDLVEIILRIFSVVEALYKWLILWMLWVFIRAYDSVEVDVLDC